MRQIQTYILRLFVDPDNPEVLRGALQPVPEGETQPFSSGQALLTVLHKIASGATCASGDGAGASGVMPEEGTGT